MAETTELELPATMHIEPEPPKEPETRADQAHYGSHVDDARAAIFANRERARQKELEQFAGQQPAEAEPEAVAEPEPEPKPEPEPPIAVAPEPRRHKIEVGGAQFEVDDAQLLDLAKRGAIVNHMLAQQQQNTYQAPPLAAQGQPQQPPKPQPLIDEAVAKDAVRRIQFGDENDGAKALQEIIQAVVTRAQPQVDQRAIVQHATAQAIQAMQQRNDLHTVGREYPEVFANDTLSRLAALELDGVRRRDFALGVQKSELEQMREACNMVRSAIAPREPQPQPNPQAANPAIQAANSDKLERKRAAPRNPSPVDIRASAPAAPRAPTGAEIVDRMRAARGQVAMR